MSKAMNKAVALLSGFVVAGCSVVGVRSGTEEPPYTVDAQVAAPVAARVEARDAVRRRGMHEARDLAVERRRERHGRVGAAARAEHVDLELRPVAPLQVLHDRQDALGRRRGVG